MSHHIKPLSVMQYLSSIINSLKPYFPDVRKHRNHILVTCTLTGMRKLYGFTGTHCKCALIDDDLVLLLDTFTSSDLDDLMFLAITSHPSMPSFTLVSQLSLTHLPNALFERLHCVTLSNCHHLTFPSCFQLTKPISSLRAAQS